MADQSPSVFTVAQKLLLASHKAPSSTPLEVGVGLVETVIQQR